MTLQCRADWTKINKKTDCSSTLIKKYRSERETQNVVSSETRTFFEVLNKKNQMQSQTLHIKGSLAELAQNRKIRHGLNQHPAYRKAVLLSWNLDYISPCAMTAQEKELIARKARLEKKIV